MSRLATTLLVLVAVMGVVLLAVQTASAQKFENPLSDAGSSAEDAIRTIAQNVISFLLGLAGLLGLAALAYGGLRLVLGSATSEQDIARAKQIIYWAVIGLLIVGLAATILRVVGGILGFWAL